MRSYRMGARVTRCAVVLGAMVVGAALLLGAAGASAGAAVAGRTGGSPTRPDAAALPRGTALWSAQSAAGRRLAGTHRGQAALAGFGDFTDVSCANSNECEAVGYLLDTMPGAAGWNGTSWQAQPIPIPSGTTQWSVTGVSCVPLTHFCEAVGSYHVVGNSTVLVWAERWNGTAWNLQRVVNPPNGPVNGTAFAVSCVSVTFCEAVDTAGATATPQIRSLVWNGSSWQPQPMPIPAGSVTSYIHGVSCTSASSCEAVGGYQSNGTYITLAEEWNGTSWQIQPTPNPGGSNDEYLNAVACATASFCLATGFYYANGTGATC